MGAPRRVAASAGRDVSARTGLGCADESDFTMSDLHGFPSEDPEVPDANGCAVTELGLSVGSLAVVNRDGAPWVVLRYAADVLGLDYQDQRRRLSRRSWARVGIMPTLARDGRTRRMAVLDRRTFYGWVLGIADTVVADDRRAALLTFQSESLDALDAYWTRGLAVNPRGRSPLELALLDNVDAVTEAAGQLRSGMYWDSMTVSQATSRMPRRDLPAGVSKAQARDRALRAYRGAFWSLSGPLHAMRAELPAEHQIVQPEGSIADEIAAEQDSPDAS